MLGMFLSSDLMILVDCHIFGRRPGTLSHFALFTNSHLTCTLAVALFVCVIVLHLGYHLPGHLFVLRTTAAPFSGQIVSTEFL